MSLSLEYEVFPRMAEIMLPHGGILVVLVEAYFDESEGVAKLADGRNQKRLHT